MARREKGSYWDVLLCSTAGTVHLWQTRQTFCFHHWVRLAAVGWWFKQIWPSHFAYRFLWHLLRFPSPGRHFFYRRRLSVNLRLSHSCPAFHTHQPCLTTILEIRARLWPPPFKRVGYTLTFLQTCRFLFFFFSKSFIVLLSNSRLLSSFHVERWRVCPRDLTEKK